MPSEEHHQYFLFRAQEERAAAKHSATPEGRRIHLQLCARYEEMANTLLTKDTKRWSDFWVKRTIR